MRKVNKYKLFNDPIYGFISIPNSLVFDLIEHPFFQRLRRISQMGMSYLVYPGAHHTRFHHALGAMHLMQKAVDSLRHKSVEISKEEETALYIAILLHDIGHGPFSHAMEFSLVKGVSHEELSLLIIEELDKEFEGKLALAISIFKGDYHRKFLLELISSQLDMDRLDYLRRDSFYTGVAEGTINSQRLIQMLNVKDDRLVVEEKGLYSIEKFLVSRRLMYWQVYLHKTGVVAELLLNKIVERAKELIAKGIELNASISLEYFLTNLSVSKRSGKDLISHFTDLDDCDLIQAIKSWVNHSDLVLRRLCKMIIERKLLKIKIFDKPIDPLNIKELRTRFLNRNPELTIEQVSYFIFDGEVENQAYKLQSNDPILAKRQ